MGRCSGSGESWFDPGQVAPSLAVARFGDDEFVVLMPQTSLAGASAFGERLRKRVARELESTVSCGITVADNSDDARSLLARADSALYSAKASGPNRMFLHTGTHIREHDASLFRQISGTECSPDADERSAAPSSSEAVTNGAADEAFILQHVR